jgi:hypothetical protein
MKMAEVEAAAAVKKFKDLKIAHFGNLRQKNLELQA